MESEFSWLTPWDEPEPIPEPAPKPKAPRAPRARKAKPAPDDSDSIDNAKRQILEAIARVAAKPKPVPQPPVVATPIRITEQVHPPTPPISESVPVKPPPPPPVKTVAPPKPRQTDEDRRYWRMMCDEDGSGWRHW